MERRSLVENDEIIRHGTDYWLVMEKEDAVYTETEFSRTVGQAPPAPIAAGVTSAVFPVVNLEPDIIEPTPKTAAEEPRVLKRMHQFFAGVNQDGIEVYMEIMHGNMRRGIPRVPRPTAANPLIAYFTYQNSPEYDPKIEMWLDYNEQPAFFVRNGNGFAANNVLLTFIGRKYTLLKLTDKNAPNFFKAMSSGPPFPAHRRITKFGLNSEFVVSPRLAI